MDEQRLLDLWRRRGPYVMFLVSITNRRALVVDRSLTAAQVAANAAAALMRSLEAGAVERMALKQQLWLQQGDMRAAICCGGRQRLPACEATTTAAARHQFVMEQVFNRWTFRLICSFL